MPVEAGQSLSHYRLLERIGEGGMGVVWKAEDTVLRRTVAIKVLPRDLARDEQRRQMFLEEARSASAIKNSHIVHVYEFGRQDDLDFIVMELVEGRPLNKILHGRAMPPEKVAALGEQIARALSQAHHKGLLHRDLKPSNIIVTPEGEAKILDFGLAALFDDRVGETGTITRTSMDAPAQPTIAGTLPYMSPEQVRGEPLDGRSDIFSLGSVLYEMISGERPFAGSSNAEIAEAILRSRPRPPHDLVAKLPLELGRIIEKALARDRTNRYQTMQDLAVDLKRLGRELESGSSPSYGDLAPALRARPRKGLQATVLIAALVIAGGGIWWLRSAFFGPPVEERTLLVLPFEARGEMQADVGEALAEAVAVALAQADDLRVLPVLRSDPNRSDDPLGEARSAGAGRVLSGWLHRDSGRLRAGMQLLDVQDERILWGMSHDEPDHQLSDLTAELAREVAAALGTGLGTDYDYPLYLFGDPEMVASPDAAAAIEGWRGVSSESALESAEKLVASYPAEISPRAMQAFWLDQAGQVEKLDVAIEAMDRIDPKNPYSAFFRAKQLFRGQQLDAARKEIGRLLTRQDLRPGLRAWLHRTRAVWLLRSESMVNDLSVERPHDHSAEIDDLQEAIRLDPATAWGHLYLANALHHSGRTDEAAGHARRATALEPYFSLTNRTTGEYLMAVKRWEEAATFLARACDLGSSTSCALSILARHRAGDEDQARALAEELTGASAYETARYHLARYWALVGERRRAIELLRVVADGDSTWERIERDAEFSSLRGDPDFEAIVAKMR